MKVAVASGKGGTGKTTVATSLALAWEGCALADCDVEGPNAHHLLHPEIVLRHDVEVLVPRLDEERCTYCGACADFCRSNALAVVPDRWMIFDRLCHSCGGCSLVCPTAAIREERRRIGEVRIGRAGDIAFLQGELDEGEAHPVPVIEAVLGSIPGEGDVVLDAPPGSDCSMITVAEAADVVLLVTEPTPFGLHDLELAVDVLEPLGRPLGIIVNRADWGGDEVARFARPRGIPIVLEIPHLLEVAEGYARSRPLVESAPELKSQLVALRARVAELLEGRAA